MAKSVPNKIKVGGSGTGAVVVSIETASKNMPPFAPPTVSSNARVADAPVAVNVMLNGVQFRPDVVDVPWLMDWLSRVFAPLKGRDPVAAFRDCRSRPCRESGCPAPQACGASERAHRQRRAGRHLPVPILKVDDDRRRRGRLSSHLETGLVTIRSSDPPRLHLRPTGSARPSEARTIAAAKSAAQECVHVGGRKRGVDIIEGALFPHLLCRVQ